MMISASKPLAAALLLALMTPLSAQAMTFGVVPQAGLAGVGATIQLNFNQYLGLSAGYTRLDYGISDVDTDDATYDAELKLDNPQVFLNWAPFGGHFRLSAGAVVQDSQIDLQATNIKNQPGVTRADVRAQFSQSVAPAVTLGFETPMDRTGFGYHVSLGAMLAGKPDVTVRATCVGGANVACDAFTARQRQEVEDELEKYQFLPILQAGLVFRF